jgi:hypothetical protein
MANSGRNVEGTIPMKKSDSGAVVVEMITGNNLERCELEGGIDIQYQHTQSVTVRGRSPLKVMFCP